MLKLIAGAGSIDEPIEDNALFLARRGDRRAVDIVARAGVGLRRVRDRDRRRLIEPRLAPAAGKPQRTDERAEDGKANEPQVG